MEVHVVDELLLGVGSGGIERIVVARIRAGADLLNAIEEVVRTEGIDKGILLGAVGGLRKAVFRGLRRLPVEFPVTDEDRLYLEIEQPLELLSLSGHVSSREDGQPSIHAHFSASTVKDDGITTLGGHLTTGTITALKVAVVIAVLEGIAMRSVYGSESRSEELVVS
jgi:predicted DNA-binding protein with PD1-like motif